MSIVVAYHRDVYKTCDDSGFCKRNRYFAQTIKENRDIFTSQYSLDPNSVHLNQDSGNVIITANIVKLLPDSSSRNFPVEVSVLQGNNIRLKVDEEFRSTPNLPIKSNLVTPKRYDETPKWAFKASGAELPYLQWSDEGVKVQSLKDSLVINYGEKLQYKAELFFSPLKLTVSVGDEVQFVLNDQQFLNIEHFRTESENEDHLSDFEIADNMFYDDFRDTKSDLFPIGPESVAVDFTFKNFKHVYGIPEHADHLDLKDTTYESVPYRLFNVDIFEYEPETTMPMYGSIPFMVSSKPGVAMGLFWVNSADTFVDIDKTSDPEHTKTHWMSENGVLDIMIFIGETPDEINKNYGLIVGNVALPQLFSLGYHQCRWNYNDEQDVLEINSLFDKHQIPYDTLWLDIEYADEKKYFTWQPQKFPDPAAMLEELDHTGRNLVVIIDPHIKTGYFVSDDLIKNKITINDASNHTYVGKCWPGESVWIDTHNPSSQAYWDFRHQLSTDNEFFGKLSTNIYLWNDMSEPSVFEGPESTSPKDNLHYGNWEHRSLHNNFGLSYHEATYESLIKRLADTQRQRPFILTRSYFAGSQRTAAMWSGDNMAKWEYLQISIPMLLASNVAGMPFAGSDVGGFFDNPLPELLTRWYQTGLWYPFFRAHAHIDTKRREPWVPGDPYTSVIRKALQLRYALLPVFYSSFYESSKNGTPVIKPLFYENPENLDVYSIDDEFWLGNSGLLVKPVTSAEQSKIELYIPDTEKYYDYTSGVISKRVIQLLTPGTIVKEVTLNDIPMFIRGGSILAQKNRPRRSSKLMKQDPYTLIIALDNEGQAKGFIYIDDGESFGYENGAYVEVHFSVDKKGIHGVVTSGGSNEYVDSLDGVKIEKIVVLGYKKEIAKITVSDSPSEVVFDKDGDNVVIKHPGLSINKNWDISISEPENIHDEL